MGNEHKINVMQCRSTYTTGGGPDKTALLVAEKANPDKFNVILMYMRGASDKEFQIATWARERGLIVYEVLEHGKFDFDNLKEINRIIREHKIAIYHARDYKTCFFGFLLGLIHPRMKLVFTAHGWIIEGMKSKLYTWLNMVSLKRYQRIIAVSKATKQIMVNSGIDESKIEVVYNAIDVDLWRRDRVDSTLRSELNIPPNAKIVGVVGRLSAEKAISTTLEVAKNVIHERPDTFFVLVGDGPCRQEVEENIRNLGLMENVFLLGFRKDAQNVYAGLDLFLSTSLTEGIPNTVLEAMAMEVPVVHTAVGGVPEMIEDGVDGILCNVGDVDGISKAVLSVLNNEDTAAQLRKNGRQTTCNRFSFTARMRAVESIYEQVAAS
ncbi:putative glycosyltransferase YpjH [Geobacter sp. OR-1]|uniref:glycosyltransferase family 4 protein n=1 Tax=Geobacter sp. OR-1 TaxID=1266765 RepID=UPI00054238E7|nr:glycosyltransferase family 4 protein [Geobacter sp. OR-1]GAM11822.1 putative glycosyltransferase YpjH [Geobacter sp. OR-1]